MHWERSTMRIQNMLAMYLVAYHSDASVYSLTNSPEQLHGGLW
jgi:hypothetical protein